VSCLVEPRTSPILAIQTFDCGGILRVSGCIHGGSRRTIVGAPSRVRPRRRFGTLPIQLRSMLWFTLQALRVILR
jgi:hypothetical protein